MLTVREVDAAQALELGVVTDVVPDGLVVDRAMELAELICGYTPFGVEMTKQVMWANLDAANLEAALQLENRTQILAGTSGEIMETAAAFVDRKNH
jgi:enoyl-CoA hydratase/carnithine racemase